MKTKTYSRNFFIKNAKLSQKNLREKLGEDEYRKLKSKARRGKFKKKVIA